MACTLFNSISIRHFAKIYFLTQSGEAFKLLLACSICIDYVTELVSAHFIMFWDQLKLSYTAFSIVYMHFALGSQALLGKVI